MGVVTVNGVQIIVPDGGSISIIDGVVHVNGSPNNEVEKLSGVVEIKIEGDVGSLRADHGNITAQNVKGNVDAGGNVVVKGDVGGKVDAGGSVTCGNVGGNVDAGGNVIAGQVLGSIDAGGKVICQKGSVVGGHQAGRDINIG